MHKNAIFEGDEHHDGSEDESDADEDHDEYNDDDIANHVVGHRPFSAPGDFGAVSKHNQQHDECEGTQSMSPLLRRLSIRDSQRQRLATPAPHHMALNTTSPTRILHNNFNQPAHTSLTGASNSNPSSPKNRHP